MLVTFATSNLKRSVGKVCKTVSPQTEYLTLMYLFSVQGQVGAEMGATKGGGVSPNCCNLTR